MRRTGISIVGDVRWGTHFCQFYEEKQDLIDILVPYFQAGLENNEFCMWVTSSPLCAEEARAALSLQISDLDRYFRDGQIEIVEYDEWYTRGGEFDSNRVLAAWVEKLESARKRGFEGMRLTGNTFWLEEANWRDFKEYEAAVDSVIGRYPILAVCTYSLRKCGAAEIMDVVSNHAFALIQRNGQWHVVENAERKRIEADLQHSRESLDLALEAANAAVWEWDSSTGENTWSDQIWSLYGLEPHCCKPSYAAWMNAIHPDDRPEAERSLEEAARTGSDVNFEFRVVDRDGASRWLMARGRALPDADGRATRYTGIVLDITRRKRSEESLQQREAALRQTSEQRRMALEAAELGTWDYRFDTGEVFWDERCRNLFGVSQGQQISYDGAVHCIHPDDQAGVDHAVKEALSGINGGVYGRQFRVLWPDNSAHWVASYGRVQFENGQPKRFIGVNKDVTEHKRLEDALREAERRVRTKLESILSPEADIGALELRDIIDVEAVQSLMDDFYTATLIPMAIVDLEGRVMVGAGWQEVCTKFHRAHPETRKHCVESDTELAMGLAPGEFKLYQCKNNLYDMATPLIVGDQHVGNVFTGQFFLSDEPVDYSVFRSQAEARGFPEEEYLAAVDAAPRLSREKADAAIRFLAKLGQVLSKLSYSNVKLARAVAERDALTGSLNRAQEIAHLGSWELNRMTDRLSWSDELYRILGFEPQEFAPSYEAFLSVVHPGDRADVDGARSASIREGKTAYEIEHRVVRRGTGEVRWAHGKCEHVRDAAGAITRSAGMVQDITDRKRAEEQLRQAQKLESLGTLASGIAHDFNNLLGAVLAQAELAAAGVASGEYPREELAAIKEVAIRGSDIVRQLMIYAGKESDVPELIDISKTVQEMLGLLRSTIAKHTQLVTELEEHVPAVKARPAQIRQILMNLVVNASDALKNGDGVIRVTTKRVTLGAVTDGLIAEELAAGDYVELEVSDNGRGMSTDTQARMFDPFFSTKSAGRGLGLPVIHGIVRSLKGAIRVVSEPGSGTTFQVLLESAGTAARADKAVASVEPELHGSPGWAVLLVEDEDPLRAAVKKMLGKAGFIVLEAADGAEAVELLHTTEKRIDALFLDLTIPGRSSQEVLSEAVKGRPELKVILTSAYSEEMVKGTLAAPQVCGFLRKPFRLHAVVSALRNALLAT